MAKGIRQASHAEVVFNVILSALILITGIMRVRPSFVTFRCGFDEVNTEL